MIPKKAELSPQKARKFLKDANGNLSEAAKLADTTVEVMRDVARRIQQIDDSEIERVADRGRD